MTHCPHTDQVQDFLDGDLDAEDAGRFRAHLDDCAGCMAELALFVRVAGELRAAPRWDPGPALTERVLDRVLPSRLRRRWVTVVGWSYTAVSAAFTFALASWLSRPETPAWMAARLADAGLSVMRALWFVLQSIVFSWPRLLDGWGLFADLAARMAPLYRALIISVTTPSVGAIAWAAALTCAAVLWWMRSRPARPEVRHVDVLGF